MHKDPYQLERAIKLANLQISPEEQAKYILQVEKILDYMQILNQLDSADCESYFHFENQESTLFREDQIQQFSGLNLEKNAPDWEDGFFQVPQILTD